MTPDDLDTKSLEELDEIFAVEAAEWVKESPDMRWPGPRKNHLWHAAKWRTRNEWRACPPPFSSSADAVLPWLDLFMWVARNTLDCGRFAEYLSAPAENGKHSVKVVHQGVEYVGVAPTFPHAAVKAIIRAERAQRTQKTTS